MGEGCASDARVYDAPNATARTPLSYEWIRAGHACTQRHE